MKFLRVVGLAAIFSALPAAGEAQTSEQVFGGYGALATGAAFSAFPNASGQVVENPAEATTSLSLATLTTGSQAFARASTLYPGALIARFEAILKFFGPAPDLPDYPIVAEAREFDEPQDSSVPGTTMHAEADGRRSSATAVTSLGAPEAVQVGAARSVSTSVLEGNTLSSTTTVTVSDIVVGGGVVTIDQVRTTSTSLTDGTSGSCSGGAEVSGLTIAGQSAVVDRDGVHAGGGTVVPGADADQQIRDALADAGITMRLIGGQPECGGGAEASHGASGLLVSVPIPQAGAVTGSMNLLFGQASTAVSASPAASLDLPEFVPGDAGGLAPGTPTLGDTVPRAPGPVVGGGFTGPVAEGSGPSPVAGVEGSPATSGFLPTAAQDDEYQFGGVPAPLVIGLLLAAIPGVRSVRRYMEHLFKMSAAG